MIKNLTDVFYNELKLLGLLVLVFLITKPFTSSAQFSGLYAEENWTFIAQDLSGTPSDGSINLSNMPTGFTLAGNDDELEGANTIYSITVPEDGNIKFRWSYTTDDGPEYDLAGYRLNGTTVTLTDTNGGSNQEGEQSVTVSSGDAFEFFVDASDACCGRGFLTIEAFSTADNTPPSLDALADIISEVNPGQIDVSLEGITAGILEPTQTVTITASSSNTSVIPNPTITYTSPDETGTLSFTPIMDAYGDATITISVMDDGGTDNGSIDQIDVSFDVSIASNFPPEIDDLTDVLLEINETLNIDLTGISAGVGETQVVSIIATSSNQSVVADDDLDITYTSPNTSGILDLIPALNASGETIISITVIDDGGVTDNGINETTISFILTVEPNVQPTINTIDDLTLFVNATEQVIDLSGISFGDLNVDQELSLIVTSSNTDLIPTPTIAYTSPETTGSLTFTPLTDQFGESTITVTLSDNAGTSNEGVDEISFSFDVFVQSNFAPEIDPIANITMGVNELQRTIALSGINAGTLSDSENISITATSSNLDIIDESGIQINYTSPEETGSLTLDLVADAIGESTITVTVSDDGGTAGGGIDVFEETFVVRVLANRVPTVDQRLDVGLDVNAVEQTIDITGITSGEDVDYQTISITATSDNTDLIPEPVVAYTSPDAFASLVFTPVTDAIGTANITVTVSDDGGVLEGGINTTSMTFAVSVTGNQPPTLDIIEDVLVNEVNTFSVDLSGISDGTGFTQNLTITATSDNAIIIPDPIVNYAQGEGTGSLDFEPTDFGDATITVTISDDGGTDDGGIDTFVQTFDIHIGENTAPHLLDYNNGISLDGLVFAINNGQGQQSFLFSPNDNDGDLVTTVTINTDDLDFSNVTSVVYTPGSFIGGLIFSPASGQTGIIEYEVTVMDDGGTENNGIDTSVSTITVVFTEPTTYEGSISDDDFENHIQPFTIDQSGYTFIQNFSGDIDANFSLYQNSYNPSSPDENLISEGVEILEELEEGIQYILVMSSNNGEIVEFTNAIGLIEGNVGFGYVPNLGFIDDISMDEDDTETILLTSISDGNGNTDNITLNAVADEEGAFDSFSFTDNLDGTASMIISPADNYNGANIVTVTVSSESNAFERSFEVTVTPEDDEPIFSDIEDQTLDEETELSFTVSAIDVDDIDHEITYSLDNNSISNGMSIDEDSGEFTWEPTEEQDGTYNVTITAEGSNEDGTEEFDIVVLEVNQAPVLSPIENQEVDEELELTFTASAMDVDLPTNTLSFSLDDTSVANGMTIDASTGVFTWTPTGDQGGTYSTEVTVSDGELTDSGIFTTEVIEILGLDEEISIAVYPNPVVDYLQVKSNEVISISLFDLNGQQVMNLPFKNQLDVSSLKSGTYLIQLKDTRGNVISTNQIIKN